MIRIKGHDELGFLDLGRVDQEYIPGPKLCEILANTELDKMVALKGQQLRLITSVISSERVEHKGLRFTEVFNDYFVFFSLHLYNVHCSNLL